MRLSTLALPCTLLVLGFASPVIAQEVTPPGHTPESRLLGMEAVEGPLPGSVPHFAIEATPYDLERIAQPDTYLDKTGRRFALLGTEAGRFEAWAWPVKLFTDLQLSFFVAESTVPIEARDIVQRVEVRPAVTTITYLYQSFTVQAHIVAAIEEPGAVILLDVETDHPLSVVVGFLPALQPMWPAGMGGQYARWQEDLSAYLISESSRRNHGFIGSPAGRGMSYTPAHMLGQSPNQFRIDIPSAETVRGRLIPIVTAGGKGSLDDVRAAYDRIAHDPEAIYRDAVAHFDGLLGSTMSITTPEPRLDLAFEWAKISYENLLAVNPDFNGTGLMAGLDQAGRGGRPGFGWFFGGDSYVNSLSLNALGMFDASRDALTFMAQFQREDGKLAHEVTQAWEYVDWFGDYPYAWIHADTTPWFIVALHEYFRATGDLETVEAHWEVVERAYAFCLSTDIDGDGLMDNEAAGLGALEFGALTGIRTDIYLGAIWTRALRGLSELATLMDDGRLARDAADRYEQALAAFEKFWSPSTGHYAYAFNADGAVVEEVTPWGSVGVLFGLGGPDRRVATMERLTRSDMATDWGVRMLSTSSGLFEPLNYNYGAVWPFVTSWVTAAQFAAGRPVHGYSTLMSTVQHVYNRSLGHITEVMSGIRHTWPQESVPHQGFATASTVLPAVRGLFGLDYDAAMGVVTFAPQVPAGWEHYRIARFRFGTGQLDVSRGASAGREVFDLTASGQAGTLRLQPLYPIGTEVASVTVDGRAAEFETRAEAAGVRLLVSLPLSPELRVEVSHSVEPAVVPPVWVSPLGADSRGVRVLSIDRQGSEIVLRLEALSGETHGLGLTAADRIDSVEGGELRSGTLWVSFAPSDRKHTTKTVRLRVRD